MKKNSLLLTFLLLVGAACRQTPEAATAGEPYETPKTATSSKAMVATAHPEATRIGLEILQKGGNAVDASVAVQLALAVVYQRAGNIGGGGFMVYRTSSGELATLDYRETAPAAASKDMYLNEKGEVIPDLSVKGHLAAGVPGTVAGLVEAHQKYGKLPFADLVQPAIELAEQGFLLTSSEAEVLNKHQDDFKKHNTSTPVFIKKDGNWKVGDRIVQKDLAHTLQLVQTQGRAGFYEGETADKIVAEMKAGGGIITHQDLKNYEAKWRTPLTFEYKNYRVISMPPPSSGGVCLAQMLGMVEDYPLQEWGFGDPRTVQLMAEVERRAFADRAQHLGDEDFYDVPMEALLDKIYLENRMLDFDLSHATPSDSIGAGQPFSMESMETTHLSIVDGEGNAVAVTTTLNSNFGSKVVVGGAGFFLNNEMDDFSVKAGVPNQFGLVGSVANAIEPKKRMLSSMTPTIIEQDGNLFMVLGSPGGSTIITSVFQVFLNVSAFGMTVGEAVQAKRFHHQWLPDQIKMEVGVFDEKTHKALEELGYQFEEVESIGRVEAIVALRGGTLMGAADERGDDTVMGY